MTNTYRKGTKKWYIEEMNTLMAEHKLLSDKVFELVEKKEVTYGTYLVHGHYNIYPVKWLVGLDGHKCKYYGTPFEETKVHEFKTMYQWTIKAINDIEAFLNNPNAVGWMNN